MRQCLARRYPLVLAFFAGAAVMVLEVVGTRVVGAFYGSSVEVWGALISVTLLSLAVGYWIGGRMADRWPRPTLLYLLQAAAGLVIPTVLLSRQLLTVCYAHFGMTGGALASALVIFSVPLVLLAMTGPFVMRLRRREDGRVGRVAGAVSAVSTVGSVVGTLAATLVLVPYVGTQWSLVGCGAGMVLVAAVGFALSAGLVWLPAGALLAAVALTPAALRERPPEGLKFAGHSVYGRVLVLERQNDLFLLVNGVQQTGMPTDIAEQERAALLRNWNYDLELLPYFNLDGKRALIIGLGGGLAGRLLANYGIESTAVELDPTVARLATDPDLFGFKGKVIVGDGRRLIEDEPADAPRYDFCVLDAYSADVLPFHLVTREMFEAVRARLDERGVLGINYIGEPKGWVLASLVKTLTAVFPDVRAYRTEDHDEVQTIYLFASMTPLTLTPVWPQGGETGVDEVSYNLHRRRLDLTALTAGAGQVLTDDLNPIDVQRTAASLAWRRKTIQRFGDAVVAF
jgi:MFS family permease